MKWRVTMAVVLGIAAMPAPAQAASVDVVAAVRATSPSSARRRIGCAASAACSTARAARTAARRGRGSGRRRAVWRPGKGYPSPFVAVATRFSWDVKATIKAPRADRTARDPYGDDVVDLFRS
ncbi:hypothetical protein AB0C14_16205 [Microbispora hainanensis]|uniref:hypothetical protein n=1 Tax=Microbispora hainanensis TaxID=568844 RepID=UPI0033EC90C4